MTLSRGNRHHATQACGHCGLAITVASPRDDGAVLFQRHGVQPSHGNRHHAAQACRHCGLARVVASPRHDGAVLFQRHGVKPSRSNRHHPTQACGHCGLAIVSPRDDGAAFTKELDLHVVEASMLHYGLVKLY